MISDSHFMRALFFKKTSSSFIFKATILTLSVSLSCGGLSAQNGSNAGDIPPAAGAVVDDHNVKDNAVEHNAVEHNAVEHIDLEAFLSQTRMSFNDSSVFTLRLFWNKSEFALQDRSAPQLDLLRLRIGSVASRTRPANEKQDGAHFRGSIVQESVVQEYVYTLIPTASGEGAVNSMQIGFVRKSDSQRGSVSTPKSIVTISMPAREGEQNGADWRILGPILAALLVTAGTITISVRRKRKRQAAEDQQSKARAMLAEDLKVLKAASSGSKSEFFDRLYEFVYSLLLEAGHVSARKGESDSVIAELRQANLAEETKLSLIKWLESSAIEKFSPGRGTPGETLRVYYEVEAFMRERWLAVEETDSESNRTQ